jgi:hypothetical protein
MQFDPRQNSGALEKFEDWREVCALKQTAAHL